MSLSTAFIKRPVATTLISLGTVIAGFIAMGLLPVSPLPQVDFPTIAVWAALPGASPETMATSVATPLERQFSHIAGVREMTSTSNLGASVVVLQFDLNRNIDGAARDVQAAINAARSNLPANLPSNPLYRKVNPSDPPIMILVLTSETYTIPKMYDIASSILQQELSQVDGVGQVIVGGSSLPAVRVELNPAVLNKYAISLNRVAGVLDGSNSNRPKGMLENDTNSWMVKANDQLFKAEDYKSLILAYKGGMPTRLSDVARVYDSVEDIRNAGFVNGSPAISLVIFRQPGANIIATVDKIRGIFPRLKALIPAGMDLAVSMDRTPTIRASLSEAKKTIIISVLSGDSCGLSFLKQFKGDVHTKYRRSDIPDKHDLGNVFSKIQLE